MAQERAGPSAEAGSAFVARWTELLRSPWGLHGGEVSLANWDNNFKFVTKKEYKKICFTKF